MLSQLKQSDGQNPKSQSQLLTEIVANDAESHSLHPSAPTPPPSLAICLSLFVVFAIKIIVEREGEEAAAGEEQVRTLLIESTGQTETESVPLCE